MSKEILENLNWCDKIYYNNEKVYFNHERDYKEWIKKLRKDKRLNTLNLINDNKILEVINKALNNHKIINSEYDNLCVYCSISKINTF